MPPETPPDDDDPFERLENTHRRIEERLNTLVRAAGDLANPERRMDALDAIYDVVGFFERAAVRHHEDEELSLFPRLRTIHALADLMLMLEDEHKQHDLVFAAVRDLVRSFDDEGPDSAAEARLLAVSQKLFQVYMGHIEREERELFPAARRALDRAVASEIAREMSGRRGGGGRGGGGGRDRR